MDYSKFIDSFKKGTIKLFKYFKKIVYKQKNNFDKLTLVYKAITVSLLMVILISILFILMNTSIIGWILMIITFLVCMYLQFKYIGTDLFKAILLVVLPLVTTISIYTVTTDTKENDLNKDVNTKSSVVSKGVNLDDLGNVLNGQYYFDDGTDSFYSTFDLQGSTHIYVKNNKTGNTKSIFDGFGWSFVMHDSWLYFSGNKGKTIDATYNLFRMKKDGSKLEKINDNYCYNMFFYKQWIYYQRQNDADSETASVYRSQVDGTNEELIINSTNGISIIYENKLYYLDNLGYLYVSDIDGSNPIKLITEEIYNFIIGQGKILYVDKDNNIKSSLIDGTSIKIIRYSDTSDIMRINSYKDTIFYVKYNGSYLSDRRAYEYYIYSIKTDGTNNKLIYTGVSWGFYVNILNDKVFVLDYAEDLSLDKFIAITRNMNLDGTNMKDLYRK